jgi:hypothetical protein
VSGTCYRRCGLQGCQRRTVSQPTYLSRPATNIVSSPFNYYSGLRQYNLGNTLGYGLSYGLNRQLPSAIPAFTQRVQPTIYATQYAQPSYAQPSLGCSSQEACSCDNGCETRGDCCFDYCSFCVF